MQSAEFQHRVGGGLQAFVRSWRPDAATRGVVQVVHGMAEHGGRYARLASALAGRGFATYAHDLPGHGPHAQVRGHFADRRGWRVAIASIREVQRLVQREQPGKPLFLLGHSMGGQIALAYALDHGAGLAGLVLSAPALASDEVPTAAVPVLRLLTRVAPKLRPVGIDTTKISKDPAVVAAYRTDPLVHHGKPTLGLALRLVDQFAPLLRRSADLRLPVLLQHGEADVLTNPAGSRAFADACGSPDLTVHHYDGLWHEIYNEPEREQPLADLRGWLAAHRESAGDQ